MLLLWRVREVAQAHLLWAGPGPLTSATWFAIIRAAISRTLVFECEEVHEEPTAAQVFNATEQRV